LHGRPDDPSFAAVLFADAGDAWSSNSPSLGAVSAGAGYGLRLKLPWIGYAGLDVGFPLTDSPEDESYHLYGTIGWTY
jgi:outer membrane translocation and assembly module TamA